MTEPGLADPVDDNAEQDQDHAHENLEVRRHLVGGVAGLVAGTRGTDAGHAVVRDDVGDAAENEDDEADPNEKRKGSDSPTPVTVATGAASLGFYREHGLVIHLLGCGCQHLR